MTTQEDNRKLAKKRRKARSRRVRENTNMKIDPAVKERFRRALPMGVKIGRPPTMTQVIVELMTAYAETVERDGKQPEFPLEVRSKAGKK